MPEHIEQIHANQRVVPWAALRVGVRGRGKAQRRQGHQRICTHTTLTCRVQVGVEASTALARAAGQGRAGQEQNEARQERCRGPALPVTAPPEIHWA
jgi:hypothetical protein